MADSEVVAAVAAVVAEAASCILIMLRVKTLRRTLDTPTVVVAMEMLVAASAAAEGVVMGDRIVEDDRMRIIRTNRATRKRIPISRGKHGEEEEVTLIFFSLLKLTLRMIKSFLDMYPYFIM